MGAKISIVGAGTFGTALAKHLAQKHKDVIMWAYEPEVVESVNKEHRNALFMSDAELPPNLRATGSFEEALKDRDAVLSVVPTQLLRSIWGKAGAFLPPTAILVSCSKGIEIESLKLPNDILAESLPKHPADRMVFLSGPSFAKEVVRNLPTAVTIAGKNSEVTKSIQQLFRTDQFLTFTHDDVIGVEVGGALKNVVAIATGTSDGLGFGMNARAALITRGLYEIIQMGQAMGANPHTFMGLSGIGDLVLTATDEQSRNYSLGYRMGKGESIDDIIGGTRMVAEGYKTCVAARRFAKLHHLKSPITIYVYRMLYENLSPRLAAEKLCGLEFGEELRSINK